MGRGALGRLFVNGDFLSDVQHGSAPIGWSTACKISLPYCFYHSWCLIDGQRNLWPGTKFNDKRHEYNINDLQRFSNVPDNRLDFLKVFLFMLKPVEVLLVL
jgi:hypothetical protein